MKEKEAVKQNRSIQPYIITVVVAVVVAAAAFFGGMKYQQRRGFSNMRAFGNGQFVRGGADARGGNTPFGRMGGRPTVGEIMSIDNTSVTVKMPDGSTKIVLLSDTTTYSKSDTGSKTDLKVGTQIGVFGADNADGSVTAQSVQLNPQFGRLVMPSAAPVAN